MERIDLPEGILQVKTLNVNAFYVFNYRRFSYPAAFSQSYIQRRSAGSFLLAIRLYATAGALVAASLLVWYLWQVRRYERSLTN